MSSHSLHRYSRPQPEASFLPFMVIVKNCYRYTQDFLSMDLCVPYAGNLKPTWPACFPEHINSLVLFLQRHMDQAFARCIFQRLSNGFHIGQSQGKVHLRPTSCNHSSLLANPFSVVGHIATKFTASFRYSKDSSRSLPEAWNSHSCSQDGRAITFWGSWSTLLPYSCAYLQTKWSI